MESTTSQNTLEHPTSSEQKQNIPIKLLEEYVKPKSLGELWLNNVKRNDDNDDEDENDDDDDDNDNDDDDEKMEVNDDEEKNGG